MDYLSNKAQSYASSEYSAAQPLIWQRLATSAKRFLARIAVSCLEQPPLLYAAEGKLASCSYLKWTYAELVDAVDRLISSLSKLATKASGEVLATFLYNGVEFVIAFWAAHKLGWTFVPLSPRNLINETETRHLLETAAVTIAIVQDDAVATALKKHKQRFYGKYHKNCCVGRSL